MRLVFPFVKTALAVCTAVVLLAPLTAEAVPRPGQPAPPFKVINTTGQPVTLDSYRGQVLIIDFFATWCAPCRISIPHLVEMHRKYAKQGLAILGMSVDEDGERLIKSFVSERHISYPVALAGDAVTADFGVRSVPVMFVIDKKGKVAEMYRGFSDDIGRSLEQLVKRLLAEK